MNKKYIITNNEEIEKVIKTNNKIHSKYFVIYYKESKYEYNRYCISVGKKIGNAVTRNKIKRQIKDILMKNNLCLNKDYVIIVLFPILNLKYLEKEAELINLLKGEHI